MTEPASLTLRRVLAGELCSGCGLCAGVSDGAVVLETVAPGYTRPRQLRALPEVVEAKVAAACPGSTVASWGGQGDLYWGPYRAVLTGHATDGEVRYQGSSGGALSALAIKALETGMVDAVLHIEADPQQPTRNRLRISTDASGILAGAGSRYAASSPLESIEAHLEDRRRFAFIGKPCDVSALRQLARIDARVDQHFPLMLSFFCGGVPSHAGADKITVAMGLAPEKVTEFRYRGNGWPGRTRAETRDGEVGGMSYADSWGKYLSKQVQFRCKICPDAVGGSADVAAADAWYGGETGYPQFEEQDGRSLIMVRTEAGAALVECCRAAGDLSVAPVDVREIDLMQPSQANRKRLIAARLAAAISLRQPVPRMAGLHILAAARRANVGDLLRNYLGTARRIMRGRR